MRIERVEPIFVDMFVEITTDNGLVGLGEAGAWGFHEATAGAVGTFAEYLIGEDPLRIEHHWQYMYRWSHFRGSVIMSALSAIDIALWDIAGKHFGAPARIDGRKDPKQGEGLRVYFGRHEERSFGRVDLRQGTRLYGRGTLDAFSRRPA
jgi:galactonate dehydratase